MGAYDRILVAVDGSETSDWALREATRLAHDEPARLRIVHVVGILLQEDGNRSEDAERFRSVMMANGEEILDDAVDRAHEIADRESV